MYVVSLTERDSKTEEWNTVLKPTKGKRIVLCVQSQRVKVFKVKDLATGFCGKIVVVPKGIIIFSQFIVNSCF